jgi:hypothetical protein
LSIQISDLHFCFVVYVHHWNIIMAKGKGRQSGGFASKAQKAQFHAELQERVTEDAAARRRRIPKPISVKERPKIRLQSLQYILRERQYDDQLEHKAIRQKNSLLSKRGNMSPPGRILYYRDHDYGKEFRTVDQSLQVICLKSLAQVLPNYLDAMGESSLTQYLSLLPGPALAALSIYISDSIGMSNSMLRLLNQTQVTRLSIFAPRNDDETDSHWRALTKEGLETLVPTWGHVSDAAVRESWEDIGSDEEELWQWRGCRRLERLELGNLPHFTVEGLEKLLESCSGLTHLGLSGTCAFESGPDVLSRLPDWLPNLQHLDISGNAWITENLLRKVFDAYSLRYPQVLQISAVGCLPPTSQASLELEYGDQFITK